MANTLQGLMRRKHGSLYKAMREIGLPQDMYSILRGRRAPSVLWIEKVSADLGVNVRDFLDERGLIKSV